MKKVNFKELEIFTDISRTKKTKGDARREFANMMYSGSNGLTAHLLSEKIYQSDGEIEIDEQEEAVIRELANRACTPMFIDGINAQIGKE